MADKKSFIWRRQQIEDNMQTFSHPWNPKSEISGTQMGRLLGLKRTGVNFVKVPPGKESFVYHSHYREEEWIYILYRDLVPKPEYYNKATSHEMKRALNKEIMPFICVLFML